MIATLTDAVLAALDADQRSEAREAVVRAVDYHLLACWAESAFARMLADGMGRSSALVSLGTRGRQYLRSSAAYERGFADDAETVLVAAPAQRAVFAGGAA